MAILDTIKRVVPYIKSSAGYILCRLSSNAVEMDDGNTLQEAYDTLNSKMLMHKYEIVVKPYPALNSGNSLTLIIIKQGNMCFGYILWTGSVADNSSAINEILVPEEYRPRMDVVASTPAITSGTILSRGATRITLGTDGKVSFITDEKQYVERIISFAYIVNDIQH